jgi:hypothetical protein
MELRRKAREDRTFPSHSTFNRFGGKAKLVDAVAAHCRPTRGFGDVLSICDEWKNTHSQADTQERKS